MGSTTGISWTESTWSPMKGCERISPGCLNCYAEFMAGRFCGPTLPMHGFATRTPSGARWTGRVELDRDRLEIPIRWQRPRRIFVNSQSDTFHEKLSDEDIEAVFGAMALAPQHTFQVLTKRSERMERWFHTMGGLESRETCVLRAAEHLGEKMWGKPGAPFVFDSRGSDPTNYLNKPSKEALKNRRKWPGWPLPNVHIGISAENQEYYDLRSADLMRCPAAVRYISFEPLLGPIDLEWNEVQIALEPDGAGNTAIMGPFHWAIIGGESGSKARPFRLEWARSLIEQCQAAGVAPFMKQLGSDARVGYYDQAAHEWYESRSYEWPDALDWHPSEGQPPLDAEISFECSGKGDDPTEWPPELRVQEYPEVKHAV